ncbi:glucuronate isomerase [Flaviflexus ciconiae]|uniref:Uronate isomerase n=1 Tax=Flaviflexus ciconiae TaxID=2496867 RepID=A0A3S9PWB5_9ACTO|nr:glucuronate isomerase [Flaviflexus ciconiae]AZQ76582.1 glucuronate isomerase [Flaviflexus ciconiae]
MTTPRTGRAPLTLHPDRLFPADPTTRDITRKIYQQIVDLPIISPHGHVPVEWLADDIPFTDPTSLLLTPDHYTNRMLHGAGGVELSELGVPVGSEMTPEQSRNAFRKLCENWKYFRGTPVRYWFEQEFYDLFDVRVRPSADTADEIYDQIAAKLATPEYRPRALYQRFNIGAIATTDDPCSDLSGHAKLLADPTWDSKVAPTFRPDAYLEPGRSNWNELTNNLGEVTGVNVDTYAGNLEAMRTRRQYFKEHGAVSSDHSHADAGCERLSDREAEALYAKARQGTIEQADADRLRRHMINDQAKLATEDGLVMTLHPGVYRNHDTQAFERYGADVGGDVPYAIEFTKALQPILDSYGNVDGFQLVVFTMDETVYSRELAPMAGYYRCLFVGAPWWFIDEADAIMRYRRSVTGYAGFYKTSGFIDDTRAFCSIPARHDLARRIDSAFLGGLVAEHRLDMDEAVETAIDIVTTQPRKVFKL